MSKLTRQSIGFWVGLGLLLGLMSTGIWAGQVSADSSRFGSTLAQLPAQQFQDLIRATPEPSPFLPTLSPTLSPTFPVPEPTLITPPPATPEPTPLSTPPPLPQLIPVPDLNPLDPGTNVSVGGIPVFKLQTADYTSELRSQVVESVIEDFLEIDIGETEPPRPQVEVEQLDNQYVLFLGERDNFIVSKQYLFTVTNADTAAEQGISNPRINDVRDTALRWAEQLETAIDEYRQLTVDNIRGQHPVVFVLTCISAIAVVFGGFFLWRLCHRSLDYFQPLLEKRFGSSWRPWVHLGISLTRLGLWLGIAGGTLHLAISAVPRFRLFQRLLYFELGQFVRATVRFLSTPLPNSTLTIMGILVFAGLTIIIFSISHYLSLAVRHRFLARIGLDLGTQEASSTIFKYGMTLLGMLLVLPFTGLSSSLTVVAATLGLAIGLGLQNIFNDYVSYLAILVERPIQVGDLIEVDTLIGTVERIHPWATVVRTLDRVFVIVPNSRLTDRRVVNWSYRDPRCRIHVPVSVSYGSDTDLVKEALLYVATHHPSVLSTPEPQVWLTAFGTSSLDFELLVWINRPQDQFLLKSELNYAIDAEFRRRNIIIPFPQQDLHIRSADALLDLLAGRMQASQSHDHLNHTDQGRNVQGRIILPYDHRQSKDYDSWLMKPDSNNTNPNREPST